MRYSPRALNGNLKTSWLLPSYASSAALPVALGCESFSGGKKIESGFDGNPICGNRAVHFEGRTGSNMCRSSRYCWSLGARDNCFNVDDPVSIRRGPGRGYWRAISHTCRAGIQER